MKLENILLQVLLEQAKTYEQIKTEWSAVNSDDDTSTKGFGEGKSQREDLARRIAQMNGRKIVAKKLAGIKPSEDKPFEVSVSASEVDSKMYYMNGVYVALSLMDRN